MINFFLFLVLGKQIPLKSSKLQDASVVEQTGESYNFALIFDCPIKEGSIKVNLVCLQCTLVSPDQKVWVKFKFENDAYVGIEHEQIDLLNGVSLTRFVPSDRVEYNTETYTLSFYVDSQNVRLTDYDTENTLLCPTPTPKPALTSTPTSVPTSTPTSVPTSVPTSASTPEPTNEPDDIIVFPIEDTTSNKRHEFTGNEDRFLLTMNRTTFTSIDSQVKNGGALYISNIACQCSNSAFKDCSSQEFGGAAYLSFTYDIDNFFILENIDFLRNQAQCGGAVYIYSDSKKDIVKIHSCTYIGNKALKEPSSDNLYGGSSIYLVARKISLRKNTFTDNEGHGDLRIVNNFNRQIESISSKFISLNNDVAMIENCNFEISPKLSCSIFFYRGNYGSSYELRSCTFSGKLAEGSHFIDGKSISSNSPKLIVEKCRFSSDLKRALNLNSNCLSIDLNDQLFDEGISENKPISSWKIVLAIAVPAFVVVAVATVIIVVKKRKSNSNEEIEMNSEVHNNLIDEALI